MNVSDLDYTLPPERIAQFPLPERDASRLLLLDRASGRHLDSRVRDLASLLTPSLFVFNTTRVIPARLEAHRPSGGRVSILLVEQTQSMSETDQTWLAMVRGQHRIKPGEHLSMGEESLRVVYLGPDENTQSGLAVLRLMAEGGVTQALELLGDTPLPPYIRRHTVSTDRERYQTVFSRETGSVAAPTAGLHFTSELLAQLRHAGHQEAHVTLHVGPGTFAPVKVEDLSQHPMHTEVFDVPDATCNAIARAKAEGRPVVAVGTTVVRTLEAVARTHGELVPGRGRTDLLISPPYPFQIVDALFTNFHAPRSTLMALVMALGGQHAITNAYEYALAHAYRFLSYGDAMLIANHWQQGVWPHG